MSLKSTLEEFKAFAIKGNVIDMAVGVIIGGAFGKIVSSLVGDIVMPLVGKLTGGTDFSQLFIPLDGNTYATLEDAKAATATLAYGAFVSEIINFFIIALAIFFVLKLLMNFKKQTPEAVVAPTTKNCPFCKTDISIEATRCPSCTSHLENQ